MREHPVLKQLYTFQPEERECALLWLGQNGFLIKTKSCVFFFDPYLSDFAEQWTWGWHNEHIRIHNRVVEPKEIYGVDYVLCSHDHVDHIDPFTIPILALRNADTRFVAPEAARFRMTALYVADDNLFCLRGDDHLELGPLTVHAIPAAHSRLEYRDGTGYTFLSYIVQVDGLTIFHAGDTIPYEGQIERLKKFEIDLGFLPINGRKDPALNMEPNFTIDEAIDLARQANIGTTIPMHYDMYTLNTAPVADFIKKAEGTIKYHVAQMASPFMLRF